MEEPAGEDEVKTERDGRNKCCMKVDRETDSGSHLSDGEDKGSDIKLPVTNFLCGTRTDEYPSHDEEKRFMVYICGGYQDTVAERSVLMENVYPRVYLYCKQRGYDFQMVDLRLGVGSPVSEHHDTVELHVENLQRCQKTLGPNFIVFVGQKYEVRSLPSTIPREAFEAIVRVVERDREQMSGKKPVKDFTASASQSSIRTDSSSSSFVRDSIYGNYLNFREATSSGLLSQSSHDSFSEGEEARLSPVGARSWGDLNTDLMLLQMCYKLNENCLPSVYRLLPISSHHPDMLSMDKERRRQARKDWSATCHRLWGILQRSAAQALGQEQASLLLRTILDWEVETGLQSADGRPPEHHCHCYKRHIPDLHNNLTDKHATRYTSLLKGRAQLDPVLNAAHQQFMDRLHEKLRHTNIYERDVRWGQKGLNPKHNRSHHFYTERISSHFQQTVINSLNKVMKVTNTQGSFDTVRREAVRVQIQEEIRRHVNYGLHLWKGCTMRQTFFADVKKTMEQSRTRPILLLGPPGWGKSATMAAIAQLAPSWLEG
uniref:NACHT domain- and WD repeat-containing protein 1-like isoform X2 n=1 Tax=Scatophagus argus TaxID=75038 RepID=UPI001ED85052|nr:NACHT domain- and WD repeat-containing protein 1-like isoform X2 [Scatophagus argus]